MTFGEALEQLKKGAKVQRSGWNGKNMYIYLETFGGGAVYQPCIVMLTAQSTRQPGWLASQADMLADDWDIYQPVAVV